MKHEAHISVTITVSAESLDELMNKVGEIEAQLKEADFNAEVDDVDTYEFEG